LQRKNLIVEDLYKLESNPYLEKDKYNIKILEFEQEHSYFSNFELIKIIHPKNLFVGVEDNKIIYYKNINKPAKIINDKTGDVVKNFGKEIFKGKKGDKIKFEFENISLENNLLIWKACLRAGYPRIENMVKSFNGLKSQQDVDSFLNKMATSPWKLPNVFTIFGHSSCSGGKNVSIFLSLSLPGEDKDKKIGITHPRENFSGGSLDISSYLKKKEKLSSLKIYMEWTNTHKLSSIGLAQIATKREVEGIKVENLKLNSIKHSHEGEVSKEKLERGKTELVPGQFLELVFPCGKEIISSEENCSFLLRSKGHYKKV